MREEAVFQSVIELMERWQNSGEDADRLIAAYVRDRRYIGSHDRRQLSDDFHQLIRHQARLGWHCTQVGGDGASARALMIAELVIMRQVSEKKLKALFSACPYGPPPLGAGELRWSAKLQGQRLDHAAQPKAVRDEMPKHLHKMMFAVFGDRLAVEMAALNAKAPLDIRVNTLKASVRDVRAALQSQGIAGEALPFGLSGFRLKNGTPIAKTDLYTSGMVEIQDAASQLCAALVAASPGQKVLDLCAGGGGKTLALAAAMRNKGKIIALDTHGARLDNARKRIRRARVVIAQFRTIADERDTWLRSKSGFFDRVLIDAPCSGSGAWRRNPAARWRLSKRDVTDFARLQSRLLKAGAARVTWGGRLVYATCSVFEEENERVINAFLRDRPEFGLVTIETIAPGLGLKGEMLRLSPHSHDTDGFFLAVMERHPRKRTGQ